MKILVLNSGSSSLKYQVIDTETGEMLVKGYYERIGQVGAFLTHKVNGEKHHFEHPAKNHEKAIQFVMKRLTSDHYGVFKSLDELDAIGHRVVHGGEQFKDAVLITDEVIQEIKENAMLAPLHNPAAILGIEACQKVVPNKPMVAVFDTAFHQTISKEKYIYPIPYEYYEKYHVRKYGFHGTSHMYVSQRLAEIENKDIKDMKKYSKLIVAAIVALIFIGTFVFLYEKSQPKPVEYTEFTPKMADVLKTTVITGKIEPRNEVSVKPQISGIITEICKEAGDYVQAGEVIAKVKVIPDMGQLSSAQARVRLAEINLKQAQVNYGREEQLYKKQLVSADEFDKVKQAMKQAREEVTAAEDALQVVRDGVSKSNASASSTLIRSTISGIILDIPVKVGNSVILANTFNDGTTIASVANMNDLIFRGNIDETEVGSLVTGMPMKITIGALQNLNFEANLEYISPKAVENNGANQFEVKAAIRSTKGGKIRSGYSANAEIVLAKATHVLTVPESAIEFSGDSTFVYIIKGSDKKKTYERKQVTTGLSDGVNIEIKKGLGLKDKVRGPQVIAENKDDDE